MFAVALSRHETCYKLHGCCLVLTWSFSSSSLLNLRSSSSILESKQQNKLIIMIYQNVSDL